MSKFNSETVERDFIDTFAGKLIGTGMSRKVYACRLDKEAVIKVELDSKSFQNILEWKIWEQLKDSKWAKYLAPCIEISPCGTVLIQGRCEMPTKKDYPKQLPEFLHQDTKHQNFGIYKGKFVCYDYGKWIVTRNIKLRMKKVDWWTEKED